VSIVNVTLYAMSGSVVAEASTVTPPPPSTLDEPLLLVPELLPDELPPLLPDELALPEPLLPDELALPELLLPPDPFPPSPEPAGGELLQANVESPASALTSIQRVMFMGSHPRLSVIYGRAHDSRCAAGRHAAREQRHSF
jgi:hypothetical protein